MEVYVGMEQRWVMGIKHTKWFLVQQLSLFQ